MPRDELSENFEKEARKEEQLFLSLCSQRDKQKLMKQIPMSFQDYLRITCIISFMDLVYYEVKLNELFPELHEEKEQMLKRHKVIISEYPDYYKDEDVYKKVQDLLTAFCCQISDKEQQDFYAKKFDVKLEHDL